MKTTQTDANPIAKRDLEWRRLSDGTVVVAHREGQHLALAADEFDLLRSLDGTCTIEDIRDRHGDASVELLNDCSDAGLLVGSHIGPQPRVAVSHLGGSPGPEPTVATVDDHSRSSRAGPMVRSK